MVNFTVALPEDLKAEMEKFSDVNWSDFIRKNIQLYLRNRKNSFPPLNFELEGLSVLYNADLKRPSMRLYLTVTNKMDIKLIIDRILFKVEFDKEFGRNKLEGAFVNQSLEYQPILTGETKITIDFYPQLDMLFRLNKKMDATFWVYVTLTTYVQGFESAHTQVIWTKFPIDGWRNAMSFALDCYNTDWKSSPSLDSE